MRVLYTSDPSLLIHTTLRTTLDVLYQSKSYRNALHSDTNC